MADEMKASIRLQLEDAVSGPLKALQAQLAAMQAQLTGMQAPGVKKIGQDAAVAAPALARIGQDAMRAAPAIRKIGEEASAAGGQMSSSAGSAGLLSGALGRLASIAAGTLSFGALVTQGIEFNRTMEDSRSALAAMILGTHEFTNAIGGTASAQEAMAKSFEMAEGVQQRLWTASKGVSATYQELLAAFQAGFGPAMAAGITDMRKLETVIVSASQAVKVLVKSSDPGQMMSELRAIFTGEQATDNTLNRVLGITAEQIKRVKAEGKDLADFYMQKLAPYSAIAAASTQSFSVQLSNLKQGFASFAGAVTEAAFADIPKIMSDLATTLEGLAESARAVGRAVGENLKAGFESLAGPVKILMDALDKRVADSGGTWAAVWQGLAVTMNNLFGHLRLGLEVMVEAALHPLDALRATFGATLAGMLGALSNLPRELGMDALAGALERASGAIGDWASKNNSFLAGAAKSQAEVTAAWEKHEKAIVGVTTATKTLSDVSAEAKTPGADPKELEKAAKALEKITALKEKLELGLAGAGLEGYSKSVADVNKKYGEMILQVEKLDVVGNKTINEMVAGLKTQISVAQQSDLGKVLSDYYDKGAKAAQAYSDLTGRLREEGKTDALSTIKAEHEAKLQAIDKQLAAAIKAAAEEGAGIDELVRKKAAAEDAAEAARKAENERARRQSAEVTSRMSGDWATLFTAMTENARAAGESVQSVYSKMASAIRENGTSMADGITGALYEIRARTERMAQSTQTLIVGLWDTIGKGFEDGVYNVISGKASSLTDVLKGVWDEILRGFSKFLVQMLQRLILGNSQANAIGLFGGLLGGTANAEGFAGTGEALDAGNFAGSGEGIDAAGGGLSTILGQLGLALGVGAVVGQIGNGKYNQIGAMSGALVGAAIGSVIPVIGTAIGAVVGAIIGLIAGAISSPNTEESISAAIADNITSSADSARATIVSVARAAKYEGSVKGLLDTYNKTLADMTAGAYATVSSGDGTYNEEGMKWVMSTLIPKIAMQAAFGQVGYGMPSGNRDATGGRGGLDWWMPGMNKDGDWVTKQLYSEDSVMFKMLVGVKDITGKYLDGLGFSVEKFGEIATKLSTDDPAAFKKWLLDIVGVVVGFKDLSTKFGGDLMAEVTKRAGTTQLEAIKQANLDLVAEFADLQYLTGDEQIARAKELIQLASERYEAEISYLTQVKAAFEQVQTSIDAHVGDTESWLMGKDANWALQDERNAANMYRQQFNDYSDPAAAATAAQQAVNSAGLIIQSLRAVYEQLKAGMEQLHSSIDSLVSDTGEWLAAKSDAWKLQDKRDAAYAARTAFGETDAKLHPDLALKYAQEAVAAAGAVIAGLEANYAKLRDGLASIRSSIDSVLASTAEWSAQKGADWKLEDQRRNALSAQASFEAIDAKKNPDQALTWAQAAIAAAQAVLTGLESMYEQAKSLKAEVHDLVVDFANPRKGIDPATGLSAYVDQALAVQEGIREAMKLSGQAQLDAIAKVKISAVDLYKTQQALLQAVADQARALKAGVADTRWQMDYGDMTPQEQAVALKDKVQELMRQLQTSTDPAEIGALQQQIRQFLTQYYGLFSEDDPNKDAAHKWVDDQLTVLEGVGTGVLNGIKTAVEGWSVAIADGLFEVEVILEAQMVTLAAEIERWGVWLKAFRTSIDEKLGGAMDALKLEIEQWRGWLLELRAEIDEKLGGAMDALKLEIATWTTWLGELRAEIDTKLGGIVASLEASNIALKAEVDKAVGLFTNVNAAVTTTPQAVNNANAAFDRSRAAVDAFTTALGLATKKLRGDDLSKNSGPATELTTSTASATSPRTIADVVTVLRRNRMLAT